MGSVGDKYPHNDDVETISLFGREHYEALGRLIDKADTHPENVSKAKLLGAVAIEDSDIEVAKIVMNLRSYELWATTNEAIRLDNQRMLALLYMSSVIGITRSNAKYSQHMAKAHHGQFLLPREAIEADLNREEYAAILNIIKQATIDKIE